MPVLLPKEAVEKIIDTLGKLPWPEQDKGAYIKSLVEAGAIILQANQGSGEENSDLVEELTRLTKSNIGLKDDNENLNKQSKFLLKFLSNKNAIAAAALGACWCWGDIPYCPECKGSGKPGYMPPTTQFLDQMLISLIERQPKSVPSHLRGLLEKNGCLVKKTHKRNNNKQKRRDRQ